MSREEQFQPNNEDETNNKKLSDLSVKCIFCKSDNYTKQGYRKTKNRGKIQKFFCKDCKKFFTNDEGFYRMRNHPQKITLCMDLFFRGVSLRKTQEHLQAFYPHNSSHMTIYRWMVKYSNMITKYTDTLKPNVGRELMSDEMEEKVKGKQCWFVDVIDTKTRYLVSSDFMRSRTIENMCKVMRKAKLKTGNQVTIVTTDGLKGYPRILKKTFGLQTSNHHTVIPRSKIIHNIVISSERGFNHKIERLHNSIRERTKIFRGFGSMAGATSIMKGYEVFYNFIRKHQAINKCPYELALPELKLGVNKWLDLIRLSC